MLYADFPCDQAGDDCTSEGADKVFRFEIIADTQRVMANTVSLLIHVELTYAFSNLVI